MRFKNLQVIIYVLFIMLLTGCTFLEIPTTEVPQTTIEPTTETFETTNDPTSNNTISFRPAINYIRTVYANTLDNDDFIATQDLILIDSYNDYNFSWTSNNTDYLSNSGRVNRPLSSVGNKTVMLTVTISHEDQSTFLRFSVTIKALEEQTTEIPTEIPTTEGPNTSDEQTTEEPSTDLSTSTEIPTTEIPTTEIPTTEVPTTNNQTNDTTTEDEATTEYVDPDDAIQNESYKYVIDFESVTKSTFTDGVIECLNIPFILTDGLIGTSYLDEKYDDQAIRLRNGVLQSSYGISYLKEVAFSISTFQSSTDATFVLEFSFNNTNWYSYSEPKVASDSFQIRIYSFDAVYEKYGKTSDTPIYFRIKSSDDQMLNIDNLSIEYLSSGGIQYPDEQRMTVTLSTNHPFVTAYRNPTTVIRYNDLITIDTYEYEGYEFSHWIDEYTNTVFSYHKNFTFTVIRPLYLKAIFVKK